MAEVGFPYDDPASTEAFDARYRVVCEPALLRAEEAALGTRYGASSYTTREQADLLGERLQLGPGRLLLDVGAGAGWPGVYLAESTGCTLISTDLSSEGPAVSAAWMARDDVDGVAMSASGAELPFRDDSVDSVTCSDVFC